MRRIYLAFMATTALSIAALGAGIQSASAANYNWYSPHGYVGINGGYGWGTANWSYASGSTANHTVRGGLIGGTLGFNFPVGSWVGGVELDGDWANIKGSTPCPNPAFSCNTNLSSLVTARVRLGPAWYNIAGTTGNSLWLYGTGGWAWGTMKAETVLPGGIIPPSGNSTNGSSNIMNGPAIGLGGEYGFPGVWNRWSAKVEYLYVPFTAKSFSVDNNLVVSARDKVNVLRVGLNYHW